MGSSVGPTGVRFDHGSMCVELSDGRTFGLLLAWSPRLLRARWTGAPLAAYAAGACIGKALDADVSADDFASGPLFLKKLGGRNGGAFCGGISPDTANLLSGMRS